jgi:hypothetical protein
MAITPNTEGRHIMYGCERYQGHIISRRARSTRTTVVLLHGPESGMTDYPYLTLCDEHGGVCEHERRADALRFLSHPEEWCPICQEVTA